MSQETILIYDDEAKRIEGLERELDKALTKSGKIDDFNVISLDRLKFQNMIKALELRRLVFRNGKTDLEDIPKDDAEEVDNASIFFIDYDLLSSQENEKEEEELFTGSLTGEIVAYLVRCFSKCKLIVGLNQYDNNPFDLTLRGDLHSFADLNLGDQQLGNPNLWMSDWENSRHEYRPWSWPNLSDSIHNFNKRIEEVQEKLNEPISEVIGFDLEVFQLLPREIVQFIGKHQEKKEPYQMTFREFVTKSGNGLRSKDTKKVKKGINDHVLARVGAARISKWLEQLILPEQDILVDAPHLISRYPSLITGDKEEIGTWNKTAQLTDFSKLGINTDLIEPYRFKKSYWVSRSVWFWDEVCQCKDIQEVSEPWLTVKPHWVFCEDTSCFREEVECKEFLADIVSPFTRRFVKDFDGVNYQPRVRFSL